MIHFFNIFKKSGRSVPVPRPREEPMRPEDEIIVPPKKWRIFGRFSLFALVALTPLFFLPATIAPVEINKMFLAFVLLVFASIAFLANVIETRSIRYPRSLLGMAILSLFGVSLVSTLFSRSSFASLYGGYIQPDSLFAIILYVLAFFLTFYFLDEEDLPFLGKLFLGSVGLSALIGLFQLFHVFPFPWSFSKDGGFNTFGSIFGLGLSFVMIFVSLVEIPFHKLKPSMRIVLVCMGLLSILGLLILNDMLLWISLSLLMITISAFRFMRHSRFGVAMGIVVVALFLTLISKSLPSITFAPPAEMRPNAAASLAVVKGVLSSSRAFFGSGPATFGYDYSAFRPLSLNATNLWGVRFNYGFNFFFTILATTGILGLLSVFLLIYAFFRNAMTTLEDSRVRWLVSGIFFVMLSWLFYPGFFVGLLLTSVGLGLLEKIAHREHEISFSSFSRGKLFGMFVSLIVLMAVVLSSLYFVSRKYVAAIFYERSITALTKGDLSLGHLGSLLTLDQDNDLYLRLDSQYLLAQVNQTVQAQNGSPMNSAVQNQVQGAVTNAVQLAKRATEVNPNDILNWNNLGNIYETIMPLVSGTGQLAEESYRVSMKLDPQSPEFPLNVARVVLAGGGTARSAEVEKLLAQSLALKADYAPANFLLAQLYIQEGNTAKAIQKVEEAKASNPFDSGISFQLGLMYYQADRLDDAQGAFEWSIGIDPNYSNARYFLGLIYDRKGDKQKAIEQFQMIARLNPDNAEIAQIIANLQAGKSALQKISPPEPAPEKRTSVPVPEKDKKP